MKKKYAVYIKDQVTKKWEVMKLIVDPKKTFKGLAIYSNKDDALFTDGIAHAIGYGFESKVGVYNTHKKKNKL